jgi:glycogen synthase
MQHLEDYRNYVKHLAEKHSSKIIYNADKDHAVILLSELIKNSKESVRIVCKNMDPDVTGKPDYLKAMKSFLDKDGTEVKILMTDYYKDKSIFDNSEIFSLLKKYKNQVELKYVEESDSDSVYIDGKLINFTTSDYTAFRVETDVENNMAFGNFNDRKNVEMLNKVFFTLFSSHNNKITL